MPTRVPGHHAPASPPPRDRPHGPDELTVGSALLAFRAGGAAPDDDGGGSLGGELPVDGGAALDGGGAASADGCAGVDAAGAVPDDIVDLCDDSPALSTGPGATIDLCDSSPSPPAPTSLSNGRDREETERPSSNSPPSPDSSSHGDESDKDFVPASSSPRSDSSPPATPLPPTPAKDFFETEVRLPRAAPSPPSPLDTGEPSTRRVATKYVGGHFDQRNASGWDVLFDKASDALLLLARTPEFQLTRKVYVDLKRELVATFFGNHWWLQKQVRRWTVGDPIGRETQHLPCEARGEKVE